MSFQVTQLDRPVVKMKKMMKMKMKVKMMKMKIDNIPGDTVGLT